MSYEIRTYSEEYLDQQFEIGNSILQNWPGTGQTQVENLRQFYSRENFDPDTKFYAFKDDEMVGFQTSNIKPLKEGETVKRANMEFPLVKEGHEEAGAELMEFAMETLRTKGVSRVQSRASPLWGKTMEYVEKYGYKKKRTLNLSGTVFTNDQPQRQVPNVQAYNEDTHYNIVRDMYLHKMGMPEQQLDNQFKFLKDNPQAIACWNVFVENGEVMGNSIVTYLGGDTTKGIMSNIFAHGEQEQEIRREIYHANIESLRSKGVVELNLLLFGQYLEKEDEYKSLGVEFGSPLELFHRDI